jgi:DNA-binding CsgD family transcriptional regulator
MSKRFKPARSRLRSIFRKLGISSRVHLTRLVVQTQHEQEGP